MIKRLFFLNKFKEKKNEILALFVDRYRSDIIYGSRCSRRHWMGSFYSKAQQALWKWYRRGNQVWITLKPFSSQSVSFLKLLTQRYDLWKKCMEEVTAHNQKENSTFSKKCYHFSDLLSNERDAQMKGYKPPANSSLLDFSIDFIDSSFEIDKRQAASLPISVGKYKFLFLMLTL